jgi:putative phosphonate metabolism protein
MPEGCPVTADAVAAPAIAPHRYAVYFSPRKSTPWALAGARWLGRDVDDDQDPVPRAPTGWSAAAFAAITAEPRRYGWHGTLKAPFRLAAGETGRRLFDTAHDLAAGMRAFELPPMALQRLGDFLALRPQAPCPPLRALANACVTALQPFAAPLNETEVARHRRNGLSPRQEASLQSWGYPFVLDDFRFHMTLTGRLAGLPANRVTELFEHAREHFSGLPQPLCVSAVSIFVEPQAGAPLRRVATFPLAR